MEKIKLRLFLFILFVPLFAYIGIAAAQVITVSPSSVEVVVGRSQNFTISGGSPPYTATETRGSHTITGSTLAYTAPSVIPSNPVVTITVTDSAGNRGTATATIVPRVRISPSSAAVLPNGTQDFTITGESPPFTFSVTGGSVSPTSGTSTRFTAPAATGTITFTATDSAGNTGTATITVTTTTLSPRPTTASPGAQGVVLSIVTNQSIRVSTLTIVVTYSSTVFTARIARTPLQGFGVALVDTPGVVTLAYSTPTGVSIAVQSGGSVLDITFDVASNAPLGATTIGLSIREYNQELNQAGFIVAQDGQITIARPATIRGRITGPGDAPIAGATVRLSPTDRTATTASDGTYSLANVTPGTYTVSASAEGYIDARRENVAAEAGATVTVDLTLSRATGTLSGIVTNASTNQPIAGATVAVSPGDLSATTNQQGRYTIANVPVGTVSATASASNFQSSTLEGLAIRQGETTAANFRLTPSAPPRPVVVQAGVGTSTLDFSSVSGGRITFLATVFGGTPPLTVVASIEDPATGARRTIATLTDDNNDGVFEARLTQLPGVLEGDIVQLPGLRITATGSDGLVGSWHALNLNETIPAEPPQITLPPAPAVVSVRPVITQAGFFRTPFLMRIGGDGPIEMVATVVGGTGQVTVEAYTDLGPSSPFPLTDPDGDLIYTGQVSFAQTPSAPEVLPAGLRIVARDSAGNEDIWPFLRIPVVRTVGAVAGSVINEASGAGLPGVAITVNPGRLTATTDESGDYQIADVPAGVVEVSAALEEFEPAARGGIEVIVSRTARVDFTLRPLRGSIIGRVTNAATGAGISAQVTISEGGSSATAGPDGSYSLLDLPPRRYTLTASAQGFSFSTAEVVVSGGAEATANFELQPGPSLIGVSPSSAPNTGPATLTLTGAGFDQRSAASLRRPGQADVNASSVVFVSSSELRADFNLRDLEPVTYSVVVTNPDSQSAVLTSAFTIERPVEGTTQAGSPFSGEMENRFEGQTVRFTISLGGLSALRSKPQLKEQVAAQTTMRVFNPDGSVFGEFPVTDEPRVVEIPNAPAGTFRFEIITQNPRPQNIAIITTIVTGIGTVVGRTFDDLTGQGLSAVSITTDTGAAGVSINGFYLMPVPTGPSALRGELSGFRTFSQQITIQPGNTQTVDMALAPVISMTVFSGDNQTESAGEELPSPIVVIVADSANRPVVNSPVTFSVLSGAGALTGGLPQVEVLTDNQGKAAARWRLGPTVGQQTVRATSTLAGTALTFTAQAANPPPTISIAPPSGNIAQPFDFSFTVAEPSGLGNLNLATFQFLFNDIEIGDFILDAIFAGFAEITGLTQNQVTVTFSGIDFLPPGPLTISIGIENTFGLSGSDGILYGIR